MINNMINAKTARQMSFENGGSGKRVLNILDKVQDCIRTTCQEGKYEIDYVLCGVDSDIKNGVMTELRNLGFYVAEKFSLDKPSGTVYTLHVKW